jgi:hypothetical protein
MTNEQRIESLVRLGYKAPEAEFVCLAALNSGYFVRRHFVSFLGKGSGRLDENFLCRAKTLRHVTASRLDRNRVLYHFKSKPLFTALGEEDNRNRRSHQAITIKTRLMALDFVLQHLRYRFLSTEEEKVAFFCDAVGLDRAHLPVKGYRGIKGDCTQRFFVDKMPIFIEETASGRWNTSFCYLDGGANSAAGFKSYLEEYRNLFARLAQFKIVYIASSNDNLADARRLFTHHFGDTGGRPPLDPAISRLLNFFADRVRFERRDLAAFDQGKLIQFRRDREEFSNASSEKLFERWRTAGDEGVLAVLAPESMAKAPCSATFSSHILEFNYELFGSLLNARRAANV